MLSNRTNWPLEVNELTRLVQERRGRALPVLDLTESNPTRCGFEYDRALLEALRDPRALAYDPDPHGLLTARQAVARYYSEQGVSLDPKQIFLTASTSETYSFIFRLLANPGDEVLVPRPSYPLFDFLTRLNDLRLVHYPLVYDGAWRIERRAVESLITSQSRAIVLVHPNNPTGSYLHVDELDWLRICCEKRNLAVISDEVFWDYAHPDVSASRARTMAGKARVLTFTLSGLSKVSALPQMKCAWMVVSGPTRLARTAIERLEVIADTYLSLSAPVAQALPKFLDFRQAIHPQIHQRLQANLHTLDTLLASATPVSRLRTEGGWYAILRLPSILSDEEWALRLLREGGVLVHPGHFYDFAEEGHLVVSLLPQPELFSQAITTLFDRVSALQHAGTTRQADSR